TQAMTTIAKFIWPIPDRNLRRRLPRVTARTLIVQGADDIFVPALYAEEFEKAIKGSKKAIIAGAAHMAPYEKQGEVLALVDKFIA
ncbi:MAG: alpha/beta fold hydrolase, partial [Rhizomicrobium sp.]